MYKEVIIGSFAHDLPAGQLKLSCLQFEGIKSRRTSGFLRSSSCRVDVCVTSLSTMREVCARSEIATKFRSKTNTQFAIRVDVL